MTTPKAAPEIFQIPLAELPADAAPPRLLPGTPAFEQAVILHHAMQYADKGWQAASWACCPRPARKPCTETLTPRT